MSSDGGSSQWEDLRRQARSLENDLDLKLISFSKLGSNFGSSGSSEHLFPSMELEIEQLLNRLMRVNDSMRQVVTSNVSLASSGLHHTLQRHRDILQDYSQEFHKTRSNIVAMKNREDLLGSVQREIAQYKSSNSDATSILLSEHQRLLNSDRMMDDQISLAADVRKSLTSQRGALRGIQSRMLSMTARFPVVNSLVRRINFRRRRDAFILGGVVGCCCLFIIFYVFR